MPTACFRFYAELNDFLPRARRQVAFTHTLPGRASVKDVIESLGVPHTEVDLILVNGASVDFSYLVQEGDRISVYPVFETLDIAPFARLRPRPLREPRFVLDTHLGRLAAYLRMMGFDTLYRNDYADDDLARLSIGEDRILLTKDRGLLKRRAITRGYCVRAADPRRQIREVMERFDLFGLAAPFTRCLRCNGPLRPVVKAEVADRLPEYVRENHEQFCRCGSCDHLYWPGSHYRRMARLVSETLNVRLAK